MSGERKGRWAVGERDGKRDKGEGGKTINQSLNH